MNKIYEIIKFLTNSGYPAKLVNENNYELITQLTKENHRTFLQFEITGDIIRIEIRHLFGHIDLTKSIGVEQLLEMLIDNANGTYKKSSKYIGVKFMDNIPFVLFLGYNYFNLKWEASDIAELISLQLTDIKFAFILENAIPEYINVFHK